jgi:hypothetical protein
MKPGKVIPKGKPEKFARGGKQPMFGKSDRAKSSYPAGPQKAGRTAQHATKPGKPVRDQAGDMGSSPGASQPRRPAA